MQNFQMRKNFTNMFTSILHKTTDEQELNPETSKFIEEIEKYDYVRLCLSDLNGIHLSKLIPTRYAKKIAAGQIEMYSGSITFGPRFEIVPIPDIISKNYINNRLRPVMTTVYPCDWINKSLYDPVSNTNDDLNFKSYKFCSVICDLVWPSGEVMKAHPRIVVQNLLNELKNKYNLNLLSAFEPEFRAFKKGTMESSCIKPSKTENSTLADVKPPIPYTNYNDMYRTSLLSMYEEFFVDVDVNMNKMKINIQDYSNEDGNGLLECPLLPSWDVNSADKYFIFKQAVKEIGSKHDMDITFMTKPLINDSASGCHFNHSLWNDKKNAFFDEKDPNKLSEFGRHWIGGLIAHLPAMTAICCPTVNCYRRLHRHLAPDAVNWDFHDRFVSIRVKNFDEKRTYIENRVPSSASSPYIVMAATIAAGLDGVERKIEPPPRGQKPTNDPGATKVNLLPHTLQEAIKLLKDDEPFVKKLGTDFVDWFVRIKQGGDLSTLGHLNIDDNLESTLANERNEYILFI